MKIQDWLSDPKHWTQRTYMELDKKDQVLATCLVGATVHCLGPVESQAVRPKILETINRLYGKFVSIEQFNDHSDTTYDKIMAVVKECQL
jgi:hypothetical protein